MGMDLEGPGGAFRWSVHGWRAVRQLAKDYGWEPEGTRPPEDWGGDWAGVYDTNELQCVTDGDAARWADALEKALAEMPRLGTCEEPGPVEMFSPGDAADLQDFLGQLFSQESRRRQAQEFLTWFQTADGRQKVQDFIRYCRAGAFVIG
jgi:hypothetical protein